MKKNIIVLSFILIFSLIVCLIIGFVLNVPFEVSKNSVFLYKILTGLELFVKYLPVFIIASFILTFSVHFGQHCEGSIIRFSQAMVERFKKIMIFSLMLTFIITMSNEVFGTLINRKKQSIIESQKILNEYLKVGNNLFNNGFYERAKRYGNVALTLQPNSKEAVDLIDRAEVEIQRNENSNLRFKIYESVEEAEKVDKVVINPEQINEVYSYYLKAKDAYDKKEWFNAHFFAETGISLATPKDPNLEDLKKISNSAWNNLSEYHNLEKNEEQQIFDKKYEGYLALVQKDDLKAYYLFKQLYMSSRQMQSDPDVKFYLEIAENRVNEKSFFIDETFELESFENANDIYFACNYKDGTKDLVYFKGMTCVEETGNSVQYLRDLTIITIDNEGNFYRKMNVPYAKVLPVSVKNIPPSVKQLMGIEDDVESIPYLMLKSIERERENSEVFPVYTYSDGSVGNKPEYLLLSMPYEHFLMLENFKNNVTSIPLPQLLKLAKISEQYGFLEEMFTQSCLDRLFYPIWILILFLLISTFAWNNRVGSGQYFKLTWVFAFPEFLVISYVFYKLSMFIFKLINFTLLGVFGFLNACISALIFYLVMMVLAGVKFLACKTRS
ncbi:MAG: hypothetical protein SPH83_10030 [Treponema sp.]|nr:hypothetical protein [Spirochaetales bacterium]MDY6190820.1 hypothetical protein [Treponema sp.]